MKNNFFVLIFLFLGFLPNAFSQEKCQSLFSASSIDNLRQKNELFRQAEFYEIFGSDSQKIQNTFDVWHRKSFVDFRDFKDHLPQHLLALALDPGIVKRSDDFIRFAKKYLKKNPTVSLIKLREEFSKSLGTRTYYRGLSLTPDQVIALRKSGISPLTQSYESKNWTNFLNSGPKDDMYRRITEGTKNRFSQSITEFPEVAVYVSKIFGLEKREIYIFKLEIPVLEVTTARDVTHRMSHVPFQSMGKQFYMDQPGVEAFVMGTISPAWITSVVHQPLF